MGLVTTNHALCDDITDFLLPVADDGTMRNCADPARPGTLSGGATYTTSLEATAPGISAAISFSTNNDMRVICPQTGAYRPASFLLAFLKRTSGGSNQHCCYHGNDPGHGQSNGWGLFFFAGTSNVGVHFGGIGNEGYHVVVDDIWNACCFVQPTSGIPSREMRAELDSADLFDDDDVSSDWSSVSALGTPESIMLGGGDPAWGQEFSFEGLIGYYIRWAKALSVAEADAVLDDARDGFPLMLEEEAAGLAIPVAAYHYRHHIKAY